MAKPKKPLARKARGPSKKYAPPIPKAEQIEAMIWALHWHRLPVGNQDHQLLTDDGARAIAVPLLYPNS